MKHLRKCGIPVLTGLVVLAALLLLLLLCRVGVIATYSADGLTVRARLGWFKLTVIPMRRRT